MVRFVVVAVLIIVLFRAASLLLRGLSAGMSGGASRGDVSARRVQMVRDPVCGTFVVPDRSLMLSVGGQQLHFCSAACRDKYRVRSS
jgi:uncharacterized protein